MNDLSNHLHHLTHFDGVLHWCFLLFAAAFPISLIWVFVRIIIPLQRLARQAENLHEECTPNFNIPTWSIREVFSLQRSLKRMAEQIHQAQQREAAYRAALTESQESERRRLARDIHDEIIQSLIVVSHQIERAMNAVSTPEPHLGRARQQLMQTIDGLRQMIANLRPDLLDELGLVAALETLCESYSQVELVVSGLPRPLEPAHELALFRTAQEGVLNALRHAQAQSVCVELHYSDGETWMVVRDDGVGFYAPPQLGALALRGHYGLIGLRERIQGLGGTFSLCSQPGQGTHLSASLPTSHAAVKAQQTVLAR